MQSRAWFLDRLHPEWSSSIRDLVPNHYLLSQAESLTSNDGSGYLSELFGQDWNAYVFHDCVVDTGDAQAARSTARSTTQR
eukprot:COSAG06_NODE_154_length_21869_cov_31.582637_6_plen_81_part_00